VVLESLAVGTPTVVSDRCGVADIVDARVGRVTALSTEAMADAVRAVLDDPEARRRAEAVGPTIVGPYRWENVAAQMETIYTAALEGASR
jgi:glycosyltransferase involved in cell wall biosynthesis